MHTLQLTVSYCLGFCGFLAAITVGVASYKARYAAWTMLCCTEILSWCWNWMVVVPVPYVQVAATVVFAIYRGFLYGGRCMTFVLKIGVT